jgi:Transposase DDE domain group 1
MFLTATSRYTTAINGMGSLPAWQTASLMIATIRVLGHPGFSLFRQRLYQTIAGYEDANDADRLRHDPAFQILADQPLGAPLGSQPTLSRWENSPAPRDLLHLQDALLDWFVKIRGEQVRKRTLCISPTALTSPPTRSRRPSRSETAAETSWSVRLISTRTFPCSKAFPYTKL